VREFGDKKNTPRKDESDESEPELETLEQILQFSLVEPDSITLRLERHHRLEPSATREIANVLVVAMKSPIGSRRCDQGPVGIVIVTRESEEGAYNQRTF
jgi:hypothetical protein